jgi:protein-tyrosine phosphatase
MPAELSDAFTIVTVCSGNICRSPLAQQLLRAHLPAESFLVLSAGTIATTGHAMTDEAQELSRRYGGEPDGHLATLLDEGLVEQADLVLTATRKHRSAVVGMVPRSTRYTFTLRQFARLVENAEPGDIDPNDPRRTVQTLAGLRGLIPPPERPEDDDIDDPYLEDFSVYERVAAEIDETARVIAAALAPGHEARS